jgi:hypothetical protein
MKQLMLEPGLKQHILCCKGGSSTGYDYRDDDEISIGESPTDESATAQSVTEESAAISDNGSNESAQGSIQGMPVNIGVPSSGHNGAGNSSPHGGTTTHEAAIVVHLNPVWFDHSQGWNGGSHQDAEEFCGTKGDEQPMTLCPYDAYCPTGEFAIAYFDQLFDQGINFC